MGYKPYIKAEEHIDTNDGIFLEIGSEHYEFSTEYFSNLAKKQNTRFISVDIDDECIGRFSPGVDNVEFYHMSGTKFAQEILPTLGIKIKCLYLDNMDWNWEPNNTPDWIKDQIRWYEEKYKLKLTNLESQIEHLRQMIAILPYMSDNCLVICDDTYRTTEQVFSGKCGAVVPYLLINGFKLIQEKQGIILKR